MIEKPEDVEKATLREVLEWMNTHLSNQNDNDMKIWSKIVELCADLGYEPPMTEQEIEDECDNKFGVYSMWEDCDCYDE